MFGRIKDFFAGEQSLPASLQVDGEGRPAEADLMVACAVLLVEMARADKNIAKQEGEAVVSLMCANFGLDQAEIPKLIETAVAARKASGKIDEFVKCVNERFDAAQRQKLLAMIWKVVQSDGSVDKLEQRLAVQMKNRLQLSDEQEQEARRMAAEGEV